MDRWSYTLEQRKYKCSRCGCLMGLFRRCVNDTCAAYDPKTNPFKGDGVPS